MSGINRRIAAIAVASVVTLMGDYCVKAQGVACKEPIIREQAVEQAEFFRPRGSVLKFKNETDSGMHTTYYILHKESLGCYFITAYCPSECGYTGENYPVGWTTASGEICHRADWENRYSEPTTCAISRSIHSFGDTFYIEEFDRVFVAEDTGSAVQGRHLDLFYEDYEDVVSFPTGYYEVFSVWVEEVESYPYGDFMEVWSE